MQVDWQLEPVQVLFHLDCGYTKVFLERTKNWGLVDFGVDWDIPTHSIPPDLRKIGSRFLLAISNFHPGEQDNFEQIRAAYPDLRIVKLDWKIHLPRYKYT